MKKCVEHIDASDKRLEYMCRFLSNKDDGGYEVWRRIYSLKIIRNHHIRFEPNKEIFAEDICFNLEYFRYCRCIRTIENSLYYYRVRSDSIMGALNNAKLHEVQMLAWRNYIMMPDLYVKENYSLIYSGVMQVRYNDASMTELKKYCNSMQNAGFVIEMNRDVVNHIKQQIYYFGKRGGMMHWLYANSILSLVRKNEKKAVLFKKIADRIGDRKRS